MRELNLANFKNPAEYIDALREQRATIDEALREFDELEKVVKFETMGKFIKRVDSQKELEYFMTGLGWFDCELYGGGLA